MHVVYFSSVTGNTKNFVNKLGLPNTRIPLHGETPRMNTPFVLITPSYGTGSRDVPPQVMRFLRDEDNRSLLRGVIGSGNIAFGGLYGIAAKKISEKCKSPLLYLFELRGTDDDVEAVRNGIHSLTGTKRQDYE